MLPKKIQKDLILIAYTPFCKILEYYVFKYKKTPEMKIINVNNNILFEEFTRIILIIKNKMITKNKIQKIYE